MTERKIRRRFNSTPLYDEKDRFVGYFVVRSLRDADGWIATCSGQPSQAGTKADAARVRAVHRLMESERGV